MIAYIIAAGDGSRLYEEGLLTNKPLIPINGVPMIERLLDILDSLGFNEYNIITKDANIDVIKLLAELKNSKEHNINLLVKTTPSSMHSLYELLKKGNHYPFFLFTVDSIFSIDEFYNYIEFCNSNKDIYSGVMAVTSFIDDEKPLYVSTRDNFITGFHDKNDDAYQLITSGMYYFNNNVLDILEEQVKAGNTKLRNFLRSLIYNNLDIGFYMFSKTIDVDHIDDIIKAENLINEEFKYKEQSNV
jgi:NDP-sugar pyrophosphorylase family protein